MTTQLDGGRSSGRKADSRQREITERIVERGSCTAQELSAEFGVSIMTIHRDLDELQRRGIVRKFHGGVTAQPSGVFEARMSHRMTSRIEEKSRIAQVALEYVEPGMSVILDDSTTILHMIPGLAQCTPLYVATPFLEGMRRLAELDEDNGLRVIGIGGRYDPLHDSFVGSQAVDQINEIRADALFLSTSSISEKEAFHQEEHVMTLKRAMIQAATKRYLLTDHTKLGRVALHRIAPLTEFDLIITDAQADPQVLGAWDEAGIAYRVVE
ncbi:MAG: DeoR/GlpR family DNA-binding transcription regulator [Candidatus Nanopelagicales bacterium]|nr:DeoR/GlpR family DNA-binding transcription regulator [Candidatus Nanopelagicales bacterium]MCF8536733.1 DeoR/GlpR family DNA-binding transcription regulator [Candidatus Nanopelagicales bacterium]MCF8541921.1 DeoR/GlpR family DNA-binding transcription regulator [Candidatus Nanopelagicales bacterium]MCF8556924.1 DeoR/GlpR family DNA-binding transcription regulator [Candidatus Nanopelagicales bacterium]